MRVSLLFLYILAASTLEERQKQYRKNTKYYVSYCELKKTAWIAIEMVGAFYKNCPFNQRENACGLL
jgi:hypothetical protein